MILPDVNLLVHAHNLASPHHQAARTWWDDTLAGEELIALSWAAVLGFIRITTHSRILTNPLPVDDAIGRVEEWLSLPHARLVGPTNAHVSLVFGFLRGLGTAANLTTDAHLAALAVEHECTLYSTDADFSRFPGLRWRNPLAKSR